MNEDLTKIENLTVEVFRLWHNTILINLRFMAKTSKILFPAQNRQSLMSESLSSDFCLMPGTASHPRYTAWKPRSDS